MALLEELEKRTILKEITNKQKFLNLPKEVGVYIGFDPTATSLQLGNYVQICILKLFKKYGFKTYAVIGGATGQIGDPSGKASERKLLEQKVLLVNKKSVIKQLKSFGLETVDNYDFYKDLNVLDFLTRVGKIININYMLSKEVVKNRLEKGISFTEFAYQLIQGWDFYCLYKDFNVKVQIGGSDQWGNIVSGVEIIRKKLGEQNKAVGITTHLLTTSSGQKLGKSENNALFLDPKITKPFEIYQYFINSLDKDVEKFLLWLTDYSFEEIKQIMEKHFQEPKKRFAQKKLASKIVSDIHSDQEANVCKRISNLLFGKKDLEIQASDLTNLQNVIPTFKSDKHNLFELLIENKIFMSRREIREFINKNALKINGQKLMENNLEVKNYFIDQNPYLLVKKGAKKFFLLKII